MEPLYSVRMLQCFAVLLLMCAHQTFGGAGIYKKLEAIGKKKKCEVVGRWARSISNHTYWCAMSSGGNGELVVQKWCSILNHVCNVHEGHGPLFPKCEHGDVENRVWIKQGTKTYQELEKVVRGRLLMVDIKKISPAEQTSGLEAFHNVLCHFAPKLLHFFHAQMDARVKISALHFNENSNRQQATNQNGQPIYTVSAAKNRRGDGVAKEVKVKQTFGNEWGYEGKIGPSNWYVNFPHCAGFHQSPVSIRMNEVIVDSNMMVPFTMSGYDTRDNLHMHLENTGYTVQVNIQGEPISITGGGLKDTYIAEQFHFHWGRVDQRGSEHNVDGIYFPMEMHIVHYNAKYNNFSEALDKNDGLVVLAFLFEVGNHNDHLDHIISHFGEIPYRDNYTLIEPFALREFLPKKLDTYCRYMGSLTTPPCYESVTWFIFYETIEISEEQLHSFRQDVHQNFANGTITDISDDFRPPQPLHQRKIYCSKKGED